MKRIGGNNAPLPTTSGATAGAGGTTSVVTQFPNGAYTDNANHFTTSQVIGAVAATVYATISTTGITWTDTGNSDSASVSFDGSANSLYIVASHTYHCGSNSDVAAPTASALVEMISTTKGVLFPRMTTTQKNAISSPAEGLIVYDLTLHKLCVRVAAAWETVTSA